MVKNICLRKSEVHVLKQKTVPIAIEKIMEHDIHFLACSYINDDIDLS